MCTVFLGKLPHVLCSLAASMFSPIPSLRAWKIRFLRIIPEGSGHSYCPLSPEQETGVKLSTFGLSVSPHERFLSCLLPHFLFASAIKLLVLKVPSTEDSFSSSTLHVPSPLGIYITALTSRNLPGSFLPFIWKPDVWLTAWLWNSTCTQNLTFSIK